MKIVIIEATAEELKANRTVMDCVSDTLSRFAENIFGTVNNNNTYEDVEHPTCNDCEFYTKSWTEEPCNECKNNYNDNFQYKKGGENV